MLLIKGIETENVAENFVELITSKFPPGYNIHDPLYRAEQIKYIKEIVRGTRFTNEKGQEICIGITQKVQDTIGLCFKRFKNQSDTIVDQSTKIARLIRTNNKLENKYKNCLRENCNLKITINNIKKMKFFDKLIFN